VLEILLGPILGFGLRIGLEGSRFGSRPYRVEENTWFEVTESQFRLGSERSRFRPGPCLGHLEFGLGPRLGCLRV
jgi:hypothetical protein